MSPDNHATPSIMEPPESGIKVRMYDPGFGDCFLLAFRGDDEKARYMLIDCGVHHQYYGQDSDREQRMIMIANDIAEATAKHLHVVVATHEHTDHLYGFKYGREVFDEIEIDEVWLAWTEDPTNIVAKQLKDLYGMKIRALQSVVEQLKISNRPLAEALGRVLDFEFHDGLLAASEGGKTAQIDYLLSKSKKKLLTPEDYRHPGEPPLTLPGVNGVRIYVLGPPENVDWIKTLEKKSEMYPEMTFIDEITAFASAVLMESEPNNRKEEDKLVFRLSHPFAPSLEISKDQAKAHIDFGKFFRRHYGFSPENKHGLEWRRIDMDWLGEAEQLALDINNKTNNTSLVLAIELTETDPQKVLLFAADAQVGNWLSWQKLTWPGESLTENVRASDLLGRTVLYKVGHHGSRNATLSLKGLEMMESPDLVAMIPVDEEWAKEKMNWEHPADKLLKRLMEKTRGRVLRTDDIPAGGEPPKKPEQTQDDLWEEFTGLLDWDRSPNKLWIQYTLPGR